MVQGRAVFEEDSRMPAGPQGGSRLFSIGLAKDRDGTAGYGIHIER